MQSILTSFTDGDSYFKSYIDGKKDLIVVFASYEYVLITLNWYLWCERSGLKEKILVCCLDKKIYKIMQDKNIPCVYIDQEYTNTNYKLPQLQKFYTNPRHTCIALCVDFLIRKYDLSIIYTDADMVLLKSPVDKITKLIESGKDTCFYTNKTYEELTSGVVYGKSLIDKGGMLVYWNKNVMHKFFNGINKVPELNYDSPKTSSVLQVNKIFNFDLEILNVFEFTNISLWEKDNIRNIIKNEAYMVHYNMFDDVVRLSKYEIANVVEKKIQAMNKFGHWIL